MEKEFLTEKGVEYTEVDVAEDQDAALKMVEKTGNMGVPQTIITMDDGSEEVLVGFDADRLTELLKLS